MLCIVSRTLLLLTACTSTRQQSVQSLTYRAHKLPLGLSSSVLTHLTSLSKSTVPKSQVRQNAVHRDPSANQNVLGTLGNSIGLRNYGLWFSINPKPYS